MAQNTNDRNINERIRLADSYIGAGQYDNAVNILEPLHEADPESITLNEKLRRAYEGLKRYDDAIDLVRLLLEDQETSNLLSEKAQLYHLKGDKERALEVWQKAIEVAPHDRSTYRVVYFTLVQNRLFDDAVAILHQARDTIGDDALFRNDLAYLYGVLGQYEPAMEEYLALLEEDERQISFLKSRLARLVEQEEALASFIGATERGVRRSPLNRSLRELLAWLYLEAGEFRRAFDTNRAIDRLEDEHGRILFSFAQTAADAGMYDVAGEAYEEVLERHPDSPVAANVLFGIAQMHERQAEMNNEQPAANPGSSTGTPHYDRALEAYAKFEQEYPNHRLLPRVLRSSARLKYSVFDDLDEAEAVLERIIERFADTDTAGESRFDLAQIAIRRGELRDARILLSRLEDELRTGDTADRSRYQLALIDFYSGHYGTALSRLRAMTENTSSTVANNAIEMKVMLQENVTEDTVNAALPGFAEAMLLKRQFRHKEAISLLTELRDEYAQNPLSDEIQFQYASLLRIMEEYEDALAAFVEIAEMYPQSHLADRSLFQIGKIYEHNLVDSSAAIEAYTRLLNTYPGSLLTSETRQRIRRLRGEGI